MEIAEKANQNNEKENINDDKEDGDVEMQAAKKSGHSKKSRNVESFIKTLKNKNRDYSNEQRWQSKLSVNFLGQFI